MVFDIPFNVLAMYIAISMSIGIIGIIMSIKKIAGAPFITIFAGIMVFALVVMIDNIEVDYIEIPEYTVSHPMNVTTSDSSVAFSSTILAQSERPANVNSALVGKKISCIEINMLRTGSPTDNVMVGILDNDGRIVKLFGNITASTINTGTRAYQVCLSNHDYWIIAYNDYIGARHTGSSGANNIAISTSNANPFDSTNSVRSSYTGSWTDVSTSDLRMKLTNDNAGITSKAVLHNFNDTETWAFMIFLSAIFMIIGAMEQIRQW